MVKWFHFVTFIGFALVISCEAKSPKIPTDSDGDGDDDKSGCNKPPSCGVNEVYDICPPLCPPKRCDVDERIIRCAANPKPGDPKCKPGCRCADKFYRNNDGVCVTKKECPKCLGANEVYSCRDSDPQTCETIGHEHKPKKKSKHCKRECRCKKGFYRNKIGECISEENCLKCNGPNEYFTCGSACDNVCDTINVQNQTNCPIVNIVCNPMCYCEYGYARDDNNICVPIAECPLKCSGPHEYFSCGGACDNVCSTLHIQNQKNCPIRNIVCNRMCYCEDGYARNEKNICVPFAECPIKCTGLHEFFTCGSACDNVCATLNLQNRTNCPIKNKTCNRKCYCEDGYARDKNNVCIPIADCSPPQPTCDENEEHSDCANGGCRRVSCATDAILCTDLLEGACEPGCVCKDSFTRADNGTCIPEDQCPPVCGDNEVYDICPSLCPPRECDIDERLIDCAPNPLPGDPDCQPGCRCADNYYKNEHGLCVTREECPPLIDCGPNEIASRCVNGGCWKESCAQPHTVCARLPIGACREGCRCKENYLRSDNGTCIPENECPPVCGLNEIYDECPRTCPPQRCDIDNRLIKCKVTPTPGDPECKPGCRCQDDFYRNDQGSCVTRDECPPLIKCGENEYPSKCANGGCKKISCARPVTRCVKLAPGNCEEGCLCKENYIRADNGTCILEKDCPPICGINEVYDNCPPVCPPQRCNVNVAAILCRPNPELGDPECKPGCRCADNYVKNKDDICVAREECPPPIECGPNADYSTCANGGCRRFSCNMTGILCVDLIEGGCKPGCICKENYTLANNGTCIPEDQCPPIIEPVQCDINEELSSCANSGCRRWHCSDRAQLCKDVVKGGCKEGCICRESYTRADNGTCIPEDQCPELCGPNEEYGCDTFCNRQCNYVDGKCVPPTQSKICKLQCVCKDGYSRNKDGDCELACDGATEKTVDGLTEFEQGNVKFTEQFLYSAAKTKPNESVIGSPFSVLFLLAQLALYATGNAKTELLNLLNISNDCEIRSFVPKYLTLISEANNASFDLAQKIYGSAKYPFSENFKKDSKEIFKAEAQNVNFAKPEEAARIINKWVAEKTHNLIKDLVSPKILSSLTRLVLTNAIYFKGDWKYQFKARNTKLLPFYPGKSENDEVQVEMMNQIGTFKYAYLENINVQVLQMPYKAADISFVVCLPKSRTGIKELINNLKNSSLIKRSFTELQSTKVDVSMPRLDISTSTDLKPVLLDAGVKAIFDPSTAGLSDILKNPEEIFVTSAIQKAKLLLNETGTEAAAATAVVVGVRSLPLPEPDPVKFNADHPFMYFITLKNLPIFAGIYSGPQ